MTMMLQKYRFVEFDPDPVTGELAFTVLTNDIDQLLLEVYAVQKKCKPRGPTWVV